MCYGFKVFPFEAWTTRPGRDFYAAKHVCMRRNTTRSRSRNDYNVRWFISKTMFSVLVVDSTVKV